MNMDYLAYGIIALFVIFAVMPAMFGDQSEGYIKTVLMGLGILIILTLMTVVLFAVTWAFMHVIT